MGHNDIVLGNMNPQMPLEGRDRAVYFLFWGKSRALLCMLNMINP